MKSARMIGAVLVASAAVASLIPASASVASASSGDQGSGAVGAMESRTVDRSAGRKWTAVGHNDIYGAHALFSVRNGRVKILNMQFVMACTDPSDGSVSSIAFWFESLAPVRLRLNRYRTRITATSNGGRDGDIRLRGTFGSNGRGTMRMDMTAVGRDPSAGNQIIENCQASVAFRMRRGPAARS